MIADILLKKWSIENRNMLLGFGLFLYLASTVFWAITLKYEFLSKAVSIFAILNFILVILVGVFMFHEDLSLINKLGIGLGIISIILIEL